MRRAATCMLRTLLFFVNVFALMISVRELVVAVSATPPCVPVGRDVAPSVPKSPATNVNLLHEMAAWTRRFERAPAIVLAVFALGIFLSVVGVSVAFVNDVEQSVVQAWSNNFWNWLVITILIAIPLGMAVDGFRLERIVKQHVGSWKDSTFTAGDLVGTVVAVILAVLKSAASLDSVPLTIGIGAFVLFSLWFGFRGLHAYGRARIFTSGLTPSKPARILTSISRPSVLVAIIIAQDAITDNEQVLKLVGDHRIVGLIAITILLIVAALYSWWEVRNDTP